MGLMVLMGMPVRMGMPVDQAIQQVVLVAAVGLAAVQLGATEAMADLKAQESQWYGGLRA